jgi:hypothetical protein
MLFALLRPPTVLSGCTAAGNRAQYFVSGEDFSFSDSVHGILNSEWFIPGKPPKQNN